MRLNYGGRGEVVKQPKQPRIHRPFGKQPTLCAQIFIHLRTLLLVPVRDVSAPHALYRLVRLRSDRRDVLTLYDDS